MIANPKPVSCQCVIPLSASTRTLTALLADRVDSIDPIKQAAAVALRSILDKGVIEAPFCIGDQAKCDAKDYTSSIPGVASRSISGAY